MKILFTLLALMPVYLFAQTAERQVIGSAGGYTSTSTVRVSSTVGEVATTFTTTSNIIISQGFQQSTTGGVGITAQQSAFTVNAFPNPTHGMLNLLISSALEMDLAVTVLDAAGRNVTTVQNRIAVCGSASYPLDLSSLAAGNYIITLENASQQIRQTMKIQKLD